MAMSFYNATVRLAGRVTDEVRKKDVTAAEIMMLRALHGSDAVKDIKGEYTKKRSFAEERARLVDIFGEQKVAKVFGPPVFGFKLPNKLDEVHPTAVPDLSAPGPGQIKTEASPDA